jgi:D-tagatose-1,6-bisphosphate aldolase subunit GatZ/KbaZ
MSEFLRALPQAFHHGQALGITSVCSAHALVIEAALERGQELNKSVLIEATCNQVNQDGGYTGMTPADFVKFVYAIADKIGFPKSQILLGGDHLGPNPWKHLPAELAMEKAEAMMKAYAQAGFHKLHLDCSMGCKGEAAALCDKETAKRAARLAAVAETHRANTEPVYIIGTEVPVPGGAQHAIDELEVTRPDAVQETYVIHQHAFHELGLDDAFSRVIGLVVQPGVEFGDHDIVQFKPEKADKLAASLKNFPNIIFEAHSTDYQNDTSLNALVKMGFSILKVGPWLTFAMREALYNLDAIADILNGEKPKGSLMQLIEDIMLAQPENWQKYYHGSAKELWLKRHFSLSDRIRYYWPDKGAVKAVQDLFQRLEGKPIPAPLLHQYFPFIDFSEANITPQAMVKRTIQQALLKYEAAVG